MLKTSPQPAGTLPTTGVNDSKVVDNSGENDRKSAKSNFTKPLHRAEKPSFLTSNARQAFTELRQVFTKAPILQHFDPERYIWIEIDTFSYTIGSILS